MSPATVAPAPATPQGNVHPEWGWACRALGDLTRRQGRRDALDEPERAESRRIRRLPRRHRSRRTPYRPRNRAGRTSFGCRYFGVRTDRVVRPAAHRRRPRMGCAVLHARRRQSGNSTAITRIQLARFGFRCWVFDAGAVDPAVGAGLDRAGGFRGGQRRRFARRVVTTDGGRWTPGSRYRAVRGLDRHHPVDVPLGAGGLVAHDRATRRRRAAPSSRHASAGPSAAGPPRRPCPRRAAEAQRQGAAAGLAPAGQRIGSGLSPLPPLFGVGLGLIGFLGTSCRLGLLGLALELLGTLPELLGTRLSLRVGAGRLGGVAHLLLDRTQSPLEVSRPLPGNLADRVPFVADRPQGSPGCFLIAGVELLGFRQQRFLGSGVRDEFGIPLGSRGIAGLEEGVLGGFEAVPQGVVDIAGRAAGGLPVDQQLAEFGAGRTPVGGVDEFFGLDAKLFLGLAGT